MSAPALTRPLAPPRAVPDAGLPANSFAGKRKGNAEQLALYAFVIDRLTQRPEVADVNTSVVYEHLRRAVLEPLGYPEA